MRRTRGCTAAGRRSFGDRRPGTPRAGRAATVQVARLVPEFERAILTVALPDAARAVPGVVLTGRALARRMAELLPADARVLDFSGVGAMSAVFTAELRRQRPGLVACGLNAQCAGVWVCEYDG